MTHALINAGEIAVLALLVGIAIEELPRAWPRIAAALRGGRD